MPPEEPSRIKRLLQKVREKGTQLIDDGVEWGAEQGFPDTAAALGATASAAQDVFLPEDEVDLALAAIPGGKLLRGEAKAGRRAKRMKRVLKGMDVAQDASHVAEVTRDGERALKYESLAERIARKRKAADEAPKLSYTEMLKEERLKKRGD